MSKEENLREAWNRLKEVTSDCPYCDSEWPEHALGDDCPYKVFEAALAASQPAAPTGKEQPVKSVDLMLTTDNYVWAKEFVRMHGGDEELMASWFASAMCTARDKLTGPPNGDALQYMLDREKLTDAPTGTPWDARAFDEWWRNRGRSTGYWFPEEHIHTAMAAYAAGRAAAPAVGQVSAAQLFIVFNPGEEKSAPLDAASRVWDYWNNKANKLNALILSRAAPTRPDSESLCISCGHKALDHGWTEGRCYFHDRTVQPVKRCHCDKFEPPAEEER